MQANNKSLFKIALLSWALCFATEAMAKIYKWTDANGKTHYTATPPPSKAKINTEEFKVQKIKKSSLTNIDHSAINKVAAGSSTEVKSHSNQVDPTLSAQSQCKKAAKNMPAMYSLIKNKIKESKATGKMSEEQYNTALKQIKESQSDKPSFAECVRKYNKGDNVEINQVANNGPEQALTYLLLKAQQEQKELEKQLNFK